MADARLAIKVSSDAKEAAAGFKTLSEQIKGVGTASVEVTQGVDKVTAALQKLDRAKDSPTGLVRAIGLARVEVDELRDAMLRMDRSTPAFTQLQGALQKAESAIASATARAGKMRDAMGDMRTQADVAGKGAEVLAASFGSLTGILGKMADSSSSTTQKIAGLGFKMLALGQAFEFGHEKGEKMRQVLTDLGVKLPDLSQKTADYIVKLEGMLRGWKDAEVVETAATKRAKEYLDLREKVAKSEEALAKALSKSGVEWKEAAAERDKLNLALAQAEERLKSLAGNESKYNAEIKENAKTYVDLAEQSKKYYANVAEASPRFAVAAAAAQKYLDSLKGVKEIQVTGAAVTVMTVDGLEAEGAALEKAAADWKAYGEAQHAATTESEATAKAIEELNNATSLGGNVQMNDWLGVIGQATVIQLEATKATEAHTKALLDQIDVLDAWGKKNAEVFEKAPGWRDNIATLWGSFKDGTTTLADFIRQATDMQTQLQQLFGSAMGPARQGLQEMLDLIRQLIAEAGSGGGNVNPGAAGAAGGLNDAFR